MSEKFAFSIHFLFEIAIVLFFFFTLVFSFLAVVRILFKKYRPSYRFNELRDNLSVLTADINVLNTAFDDMEKDIEKVFAEIHLMKQYQETLIGTKFLPAIVQERRKSGPK